MLRILRFLITGYWHRHQWEEYERYYIDDKQGRCKGVTYVLRCRHCDKLTKYEVKA